MIVQPGSVVVFGLGNADRGDDGVGPEVAGRLVSALRAAPATFDHVVLHPIPDPKWPADPERDYTARIAREVLPRVRKELETP